MGGRGQSRVNGEGLQIWWAGWVDEDRADLMEKIARYGWQWPAMACHGPSIVPLSLRSSTSRLRVDLESTLGPGGDVAPTDRAEIPALAFDPPCGTPPSVGFARFETAPVVSSRCELSNDLGTEKPIFVRILRGAQL